MRLSGVDHCAIEAFRRLPDLQSATFVVDTDLRPSSITIVSTACWALRGIPCTLVLEKSKCPNTREYAGHVCSLVPKLHQSVLSMFEAFDWKLVNEFKIVDLLDDLAYMYIADNIGVIPWSGVPCVDEQVVCPSDPSPI